MVTANFFRTTFASKSDVLGRRDPLQIIDAIILSVVVAVMNLRFVFRVRIRNECSRNESMELDYFRFSIYLEFNVQISRIEDTRFKEFYSAATKASYPAIIANLILVFKFDDFTSDIAPFFARQILEVQVRRQNVYCLAHERVKVCRQQDFFASIRFIQIAPS